MYNQLSNVNNMNCPICNKEILSNTMFCEHCGFEIHVLPETLSAEIEAYEKERIEKYKERMQLTSEAETKANELMNQLSEATKRADAAEERIAEQIKAHDAEKPVAFLVVMQDEEMLTGTINRRVRDILPIHQGKNVFGKNPNNESGVHSKRIVYCNEMQSEQFLIEGNTENGFIIQSISGTTYLRNRSNLLSEKKAELYDGDEMFIGDLIFVFISK